MSKKKQFTQNQIRDILSALYYSAREIVSEVRKRGPEYYENVPRWNGYPSRNKVLRLYGREEW